MIGQFLIPGQFRLQSGQFSPQGFLPGHLFLLCLQDFLRRLHPQCQRFPLFAILLQLFSDLLSFLSLPQQGGGLFQCAVQTVQILLTGSFGLLILIDQTLDQLNGFLKGKIS